MPLPNGLLVWLENNREGPVDLLRRDQDFFIWSDPNDSNRGTLMVFDHILTTEEREQAKEFLFTRYQPKPDFGN